MRDRERVAATLFAAVLVALLSGCASRPANEAIHETEPYTPAVDHNAGRGDPSLLLVLAFSGGGTRAAAFSFGVLEELRRTTVSGPPPHRMLDEVDAINGVSGGSFTALSFALYGERLFTEYETRFLKRNVQDHLIAATLNPFNWADLASPRYGRSDLAAAYYDDVLFDHATFGDILGKPDTPRILVAATDITTGGRFTFGKADFDLICSDIRAYPLSRAAAASSAVPVVLSAITLDNHASTTRRTASWSASTACAGSRSSSSTRGRIRPTTGTRAVGARLVAQLAGDGVPIARYSYDQIELIRDMVDRWGLLRDRSRLAGLEGWPADPSLTELPKMEFYAIDVSFERIADPERRRRFMSLPTSFVLPPADVDALREVAGELLRENAVYQKLVRDLGGTVPR